MSIDVQALFTNIPHIDGLDSLRVGLNKRLNKKIPTDFLVQLMQTVLKNNIFTFYNNFFKQDIGAAMGSRPVPTYANTFMAEKIDSKIQFLAEKYRKQNENSPIRLQKRFLDDLFYVF